MKMSGRAGLMAAASWVSLSALGAFDTAAAQTTQPPAAGRAQIEEVIVTARRREERLQDVPVAVTALSGQALEERNITRITDLATNVAGLVFMVSTYGPSTPSLTIRGQRQGNPLMTNDPSVSVYFAEAVMAREQGLNAGMFDLESAQVLKGPQGTLFGRNATGGALLITPHAPTQDYSGYAKATVGNYSLHDIEGMVNIPLGSKLALRVAGEIHRRGGYIQPLASNFDIGNERNESLRASLRWTPTDKLTVDTIAYGFHEDESGVPLKTYAVAAPSPSASIAPGLLAQFAQLQTQPYWSSYLQVDPHGTNVSTWGVINTIKFETAFGQLKNIAAFRRVGSRTNYNIDATTFHFYVNDEYVNAHQWSEELNLSNTVMDGRLNYVGGVYYFDEKGRDDQPNLLFGGLSEALADVGNRSEAAYLQATYKITDALSATAGGRITHDRRSVNLHSTITGGLCRLLDANGARLNPCSRVAATSSSEPTYNLSLDWKVTPDALLYITHRRGYRSGGINMQANTPVETTPYEPEVVKDFEVGVKADWRFGQAWLRTNLAAYHQDYTNIQRTVGLLTPNNVITTSIANAGRAKIDGGEAEITFSPAPPFEFQANWAHTKPKYKKFVSQLGQDYTKSAFGGVPRDTLNLSGRYKQDFEGVGQFSAQLSYFYQASMWAQEGDANTDPAGNRRLIDLVPAYHTYDGRLELTHIGGRDLSVALFGKNLTNGKYVTGIVDILRQLGFTGAQLGPPRMWGVEVRAGF